MALYEVALVRTPTKKEAEDGAGDTLILPPTAVIATDDKAVAVQAVAANKDKVPSDLTRVQVLVRPFA